uniref:Uncharacterized protein n=1 Tax=Palpitomonas bilix TaxID=652834 RepID=A0A7S3G5M0_9EUKA|mmetsp:Transcript_20909/g.53994  ORF Transcript_20909/g.53994 Transcript_20909/m.53994 type:complete len:186 (+) Transcript_20909:439-996(+)
MLKGEKSLQSTRLAGTFSKGGQSVDDADALKRRRTTLLDNEDVYKSRYSHRDPAIYPMPSNHSFAYFHRRNEMFSFDVHQSAVPILHQTEVKKMRKKLGGIRKSMSVQNERHNELHPSLSSTVAFKQSTRKGELSDTYEFDLVEVCPYFLCNYGADSSLLYHCLPPHVSFPHLRLSQHNDIYHIF